MFQGSSSAMRLMGWSAMRPNRGRFDERVGCGGALAADVGCGEQIVLPAQSERANRALGGVGPSGQKGQTQDECSIRRPSSSNENGGGPGVRLRKRQQKKG
jgi:hypothetical protein